MLTAPERRTIRLLEDVEIRVYGTGMSPSYAPPSPGIEIFHRHGVTALSAAGDAQEVRGKIAELRRALNDLEKLLGGEADTSRNGGFQ